MHKLLFGYVQILQTQCFYVIIRTYKSKTSVIQLYNLAKLRIQFNFLKLNAPFTTCFDKFPYYGLFPPLPLQMKKTPNLFKKFLENQKIPTSLLFFLGGGGEEDTMKLPWQHPCPKVSQTNIWHPKLKLKFSDTKVLAFNFFVKYDGVARKQRWNDTRL